MKKFTLSFIILISLLSHGQNRANVQYVRKNANTPGAQADLEAMNVAFKKMREMGCEKGLSWYYQGAIHNIPLEINGKNVLCPEYQTEKDKLWAWSDCTHKRNSESASLNFLLWHRMYTWYLEKIIRDLSGKKDFALPYWNYGNEGTVDNTLPEKVSSKDGSLYTAARYTVLNAGKPIPESNVKDIQASLNELKTNPSFSGSAGFSKSLEIAPHGYMHDLIGGEYATPSPETYYNEIYQKDFSGLMANVPSAGFDPVFWLHHSMIDRIWESWDVSAYGQRPTLEQLKANPWPYEFIAPNGDHVTYTMEEVYNIVFNLDYTYDTLLYGSKEPPVLASNESKTKKLIAFQDSKEKIIWEQKIGKTLESTGFTHKVTTTLAKSTNKVFKTEVNSKLVLNLDVVVYKEPKDFYTVYLRYPGKPDQYVGAMTFFGVAHDHGMVGTHEISEEGVKLNFAYYISDDLTNSDKDFEIIIKKTGSGDAKVTLEKISVTKLN
ncbi:tyrosinase family protein [Flavobacterium sp. MC2016-06]|uniref:tyrosinase family protein n=1 Tax=Flavobacterium sp. MC2016-06 TaxID=2676308 RepID=UPI0012BB0AB5|nr:tyrosinase family protein [Flavobacterium sp. MC2016-06]MBU3858274.1 tyrosinase family protein [Flavobacterium sp. MC2016-06]